MVTCEHGGNRIPARYRQHFSGAGALLASHRGFDPGALVMARQLAAALGAPLIAATVSRLVVDLNRSLGHPRLHGETLGAVSAQVRQAIVHEHYQPYRSRAESQVAKVIAHCGSVVHISSHSFTPVLDGIERQADVGLLYDPSRPGEAELCARWKHALAQCAPELRVRRNYPYAGSGDGLTTWLRRRYPPGRYVGVELELNQKHAFAGGRCWTMLRRDIVDSLLVALAARALRRPSPVTSVPSPRDALITQSPQP